MKRKYAKIFIAFVIYNILLIIWVHVHNVSTKKKIRRQSVINVLKSHLHYVIDHLKIVSFRILSFPYYHKYWKEVKVTNEDKGNRTHGSINVTKLSDLTEEMLDDLKLLFPGNMRFNATCIDSPLKNRIQRQCEIKVKEERQKVIYVDYSDPMISDESFKRKNCNMRKCRFTRSKSDYDIADAVLSKHFDTKTRPLRKPNQIWIWVALESHRLTGKPKKVNWTATYRRDSVIPTPYEIFQPNEYGNNYSVYDVRKENYAKGKTKLVATFISNCHGRNGRLKYLKNLEKLMQVDFYGKCGKLKCSKSKEKECLEMVRRDYKFYLAFENSNCKDYITEKFFNALRYDTIPVVMGPSIDTYKTLAPPNSFLHVDQFNSTQALVDYIQLLDRNDTLYNSYFTWKGTGGFFDTKFMCRLCGMVEIAPHYPVWYDNVKDWWNKDRCRGRG